MTDASIRWSLAGWLFGDGTRTNDGRLPPSPSRTAAQPQAQNAEDAANNTALVTRLQSGDLDALRTIMASHWPRLLALATIITGARDLAQDAVQDAFVQLWDSRAAFDPSRPLLGLLITMTSRRARDIARRERGQVRIAHAAVARAEERASPVTYNMGEETLLSRELDARIATVMSALPPRCREIYLLHHEAGMSYAEIAATYGVTVATARNQVSRATRALADAIEAWRADT